MPFYGSWRRYTKGNHALDIPISSGGEGGKIGRRQGYRIMPWPFGDFLFTPRRPNQTTILTLRLVLHQRWIPCWTLRMKNTYDYLIPPGWKRVKLMLDSNSRPSSLKTNALTTRPSYSFWAILMHVAISVVQYQSYIIFSFQKTKMLLLLAFEWQLHVLITNFTVVKVC